MKQEKSCGCIIVKNGKVLLENQKGDLPNELFWNFPKGHQEKGETDLETAIRETKEEVGLDVVITDEEPIMMQYLVNKGTTEKIVLLFLAKLKSNSEKIIIQEEEVTEARWVPFSEVYNLLTFDRCKKAWQEAEQRLKI